ncbi:integration host factor subunit alpha [Novosphingobium guangzhouense]|uniref:Integration host factor subunit alpha n=1 Tax=Novosphingobium guangzhouense TaxID=1850347 RepID=A0A2K2G403_9SPHN|nr:integration host factor subunit alpha [Novosphingobium guangzhouense]PNU05732.1 integration host factor subunit alpha [Novosphingobium guangzhouense]
MARDGKTLTRAQIAKAISRNTPITVVQAYAFADAILEHMACALERGENVKISRFGTFVQREKGRRLARNPNTGEKAVVTARRVVTFNPSDFLRQRVAGPID